jgi:glycosyltransferase involved in cell wall biosynthesis
MKVLIGVGNYPKLSESYIEAEIKFLIKRGLEVAVYSPVVGSSEAPELVPVFRGQINEALKTWRPDIFHAHYLTFSASALEAVGHAKIPITIRGHSFDFGVARARALAEKPYIRRIWLFPHFSRSVAHGKVFPLPAAFDSSLYTDSSAEKDWGLVYKTGAGKGGKGLPDFFEVAKLCRRHKFSMSVNKVIGAESYLNTLRGMAKGSSVEYVEDIQREEAVLRMKRVGIYMDTSDPKSHPYGMSISVAEALATGCYVLARHNSSIGEYLGPAGATYRSVQEASELIHMTEQWGLGERMTASAAAVSQSENFREDKVLPAELEFWEKL